MWTALLTLGVTTILTLNRMTLWQNSIRERMGMAPTDTAFPLTVRFIALATIGLTIPAVLITAAVTGRSVELGLPESQT